MLLQPFNLFSDTWCGSEDKNCPVDLYGNKDQ